MLVGGKKNSSDGWYLCTNLCLCPYVFSMPFVFLPMQVFNRAAYICFCECSQGQGKREATVLKTALHSLVVCILWGGYQLMCVLASFPASTAEHGLGMRLTQYVLGITFVTSYRPVASLVKRAFPGWSTAWWDQGLCCWYLCLAKWFLQVR